MLIEFSFANYRSVNGRQTLSLAKGSGNELLQTNTFVSDSVEQIGLLRSAAIYGPNAGGKTNILLALEAMRKIVVTSASQKQRGDTITIEPFRLEADTRESPSEFEVIFIINNIRYQYGFTATQKRIHEEWLFAYPHKRAQRWFIRTWDENKQNYRWDFGSHLMGEKQLWQKSTRDNALFLSTAVQLNSSQLQPVYDWFKNVLRIGKVGGWDPAFSASLCRDAQKGKVLDFLQAADLGISDIEVESRPFDPDILPEELPKSFKAEMIREMKGKDVLDIKTIHKSASGEKIQFDFNEESDGTQRFFSFAGPWIDSLEHGYVLFIDELHDNLHPKLVQFLVKLFNNEKTNPNNAQLVFTTHETSILNQNVFRRDQIWFCEKNAQHATELYPLTDFSPRKGRDNLELAYLEGRYGALPFVKELKTTFKDS